MEGMEEKEGDVFFHPFLPFHPFPALKEIRMKIHRFTPQILLLLLFTFILVQVSKSHALEVPRITLDELKSKFDRKADVIIVDARGKDSFEQEHIRGAISIPLDEVEERHKELPKDKEIVFYCT
jgi:hypothetical protein